MWPTSVVRRAVGVGRYLLIALAALAGAVAVSNIAAFWLGPAPAPASAREEVAGGAGPSSPVRVRVDDSVIFRRNLFGIEAEEESDEHAARGGSARKVDFLLLGTAEVDKRGYAVFYSPETGLQDVFTVGERVFDGPKLVSVEQRSAVLSQRGRRIVIEISEGGESAGGSEAGTADNADDASGIRETGNGEYLVSRKEVDHSIENLSYVITQARAVPVLRDGATVGFKIFNIRQGSLFERLGLRNGDVVQQINGLELNDPSKAVGLLDELQSVDELRLNFLRGGKPVTFTYNIR